MSNEPELNSDDEVMLKRTEGDWRFLDTGEIVSELAGENDLLLLASLNTSPQEYEANGQLMAASPALLAAAVEAQKAILAINIPDRSPELRRAEIALDGAIGKATAP